MVYLDRVEDLMIKVSVEHQLLIPYQILESEELVENIPAYLDDIAKKPNFPKLWKAYGSGNSIISFFCAQLCGSSFSYERRLISIRSNRIGWRCSILLWRRICGGLVRFIFGFFFALVQVIPLNLSTTPKVLSFSSQPNNALRRLLGDYIPEVGYTCEFVVAMLASFSSTLLAHYTNGLVCYNALVLGCVVWDLPGKYNIHLSVVIALYSLLFTRCSLLIACTLWSLITCYLLFIIYYLSIVNRSVSQLLGCLSAVGC